jgi:hypothetical protein
MVLSEGGTVRTETFNGVSFQGFSTTDPSVILIDVTGPGVTPSGRTIQFNGTQFQTIPALATGALYVRVTSSDGLLLNLIMNGSNDPTGGASRSQTNNGATITYQ